MGRRVSSGVVGGSGLGTINVISSTITTTTLNGDLTLDPNGTGNVVFDSDAQLNAQNDLRFADSDSSNWVAFQGPATISSNVTWTLPDADAAVSGYALVSDANGILSWAAAGAALQDETASASTFYPVVTTSTSGFLTSARVSTTKLSFQPSTGSLSATLFNETSSLALKENLEPIDNALEMITKLQAYTYNRKDGSMKDEPGLIAEYVNAVIPNVVQKDKDGNPVSIAYQRLTAYLIESIKQLKLEIDSLKDR